jgi:hydroxymethylpyrimidine pyrophosphatase-like HAD family hydrolase
MHYLALATDYDGTIAHDGIVDADTLAALKRLREAGRKLIMVSGRELEDLLGVFDHLDLFDRAVLENGALLYHPSTKESRQIAPPPPEALVERLKAAGIPLSVGRSILATVVPHEHAVLEAIRELGVEWHVIFNKGSVMALPSGVNKATGLQPALDELGIPAERVVGVGDAENDHAFLKMCGRSVAVANALPAVKDTADLVTSGARGAGVTELIDRLLADDLADVGRRGG